VQKLLEQVNVKIASVLTDVFGVSGLNMLLALLEGKATPTEIAQLARGVAKRKVPQLIEAIEGNRLSDHVRFVIRSCLRHLACLEEEVEEVDAEILRRMELPTFQKAFTLLQTIPGVASFRRRRSWPRQDQTWMPFLQPNNWRVGLVCVPVIGKVRVSRRGTGNSR
jgi:transposase